MRLDIKDESDENKIVFIRNIISQKGIPANFVPLQNSYQNKIFLRENGEQREWILFENNNFFCVYCVCFSLYEQHRLITGINYEKNCRISEFLKRHETEKHHIYAKNVYADKALTCETERQKNRSDKWIVLSSIVKIIIFQATHG